MKHLKSFKIFESISSSQISIEEFLQKINIPSYQQDSIIEWWYQNRNHIKIYYFPFKSTQPIMGVFLGTDEICINSNLYTPPFMKLFIALHESKHCDQHAENRFMEGYFDTVVNDDRESFLQAYSSLEREANDYAISSMRDIGFIREMDSEETRLRGNERAGSVVYNMMKRDIERYRPTDFIDLLKKQIS